jgi:ZIP family zinc transporter
MPVATILACLLLAALSGLTTLLGVGLALWVGRKPRALAFGIGFSTAIMLLIAVLELAPGAAASVGWASVLIWGGAGVALFAALHWLIPHAHLFAEHPGGRGRALRAAHLVALGLVLHDLPEGFAMANAYLTTPALGVMVALSIAAHNIPEEFAIAAPAVAAKDRRLLFGAALLSALAEPVGAVLGLVAAGWWPLLAPNFMALAAGAMVFISLHELVPLAAAYGQPGAFVGGAVLSVAVYGMLLWTVPV